MLHPRPPASGGVGVGLLMNDLGMRVCSQKLGKKGDNPRDVAGETGDKWPSNTGEASNKGYSFSWVTSKSWRTRFRDSKVDETCESCTLAN